MGKYGERAQRLFEEGYNCAQAVAGAFAEDVGMDLETITQLISGFGGGFGRMREVCGAFSGLTLIASIKHGYHDPKDSEEKKRTYQMIQDLGARFREANGSLICRELIDEDGKDTSPVPSERNAAYYQQRRCGGYVHNAADILDDFLQQMEKEKAN